MDEIHIVSETLDGDRFDRCLATVGEMSRGLARQLIDTEQATLNAKLLPPKTKVRVGDVVAFTRPPEREALQPNSGVAFDVLYEDVDVAVINKPAGLVVHPGHGHRVDTLAAGLLARWPDIRGVGEDERWGIVHRLDRDTSGVLCVALSHEAHTSLTRALARREVKRSYLTLVHGLFDMTRGTIDAPIGKDAPSTLRMMVTRDGKPARTHYRRIESMKAAEVSLVEVELETGRTHQIRVHLASIDHPVVGDNLYRRFVETVEVDRMFLHAAALAFTHPISGELVEVSAGLPTDLASVLQRLRSAES
jgi:23S rRNA pseudouridine1911/1915/1917 synthase